jgi:hypothetical protein
MRNFREREGGSVGGEMKYHFPPTGFQATQKENEKKKKIKTSLPRQLVVPLL